MNGQLDLRMITQPYSEVCWEYFRRLVFGNSLTKHNKTHQLFIFRNDFFPPDFPHTALFSCSPSRFPTSVLAPCK